MTKNTIVPMGIITSGPGFRASGSILFGARGYEKNIKLKVTDQKVPEDEFNLKQPTTRPHVYIRPSDQFLDIFPDGDVRDSMASIQDDLLKRAEAGPIKGSKGGNIYSLYKTPQPSVDDDDDKPVWNPRHTLVGAFQRAFSVMPGDAIKVNVSLPATTVPITTLVRDVAERTVLQGYNPYLYKQNKTHPVKVKDVTLTNVHPSPAIAEAIKEGGAIGRGTNLARHLVDSPPDDVKNPQWFGEKSMELARKFPEIKVAVHEKKWIESQKMGLFLGVAQGNKKTLKDAPRLVEMVYTPPGGYTKTILLVGKGIIMDTGGTNLKTGRDPDTGDAYIHGMHGDMAGAAAVIGAMKSIAEMKLPDVRVVALTPMTANRIGEDAMVTGTKKTARNGKVVYIENTDAEGRLVLADAMHYGGQKYNPNLIVDIATLTGGKVRALGATNSVAVMGNQFKLSKQITALEEDLGRTAQAVRLTEAHRKWVTKEGKADADVYNSVKAKDGEKVGVYGAPGAPFIESKHAIHHSAQGGAFLREFLPDAKTPWVHLDMAGAEFDKVPHLGDGEFATGFGVKELYHIVKQVSNGTLVPTPAP